MKSNNEKIQEHINELENLVKGTDAGIILAYTSPENNGVTRVISVGKSMSKASNYLAVQGALKEDTQKSIGCSCAGCSALRAIQLGIIDYDDYEKSKKKSSHTFVVETPEDLANALKSIFKGDL